MSKTELMLLKIKCFYVFDLLKDEHRKFQPVTSFLVICQSWSWTETWPVC